MKRRWPIVGTVCGILVVGIVGVAMSQPPEGRDGPPRRPENGGDHHHPPHDQLREALDADHDHQLSAEEIKNATAAIFSLDTNNDGMLTDDEFRPPMPPGGPEGRGPEGRGPEGRGPEGRGPEGRGPEGRGPEGRGPEGRGPEGRGPEGRGPEGRGPEGRGPEGRGPEGRGPEGRGAPGGPPSPERLVERAMTFDTDGDGKLDKNELTKFAEEMMNRMRPGGPPREGRSGPPGNSGSGERPERPRRPE